MMTTGFLHSLWVEVDSPVVVAFLVALSVAVPLVEEAQEEAGDMKFELIIKYN